MIKLATSHLSCRTADENYYIADITSDPLALSRDYEQPYSEGAVQKSSVSLLVMDCLQSIHSYYVITWIWVSLKQIL
jgi:hypothetical protein